MTVPRLALVVHFHQPVGNLDSVVAAATDRCYRPFLEVARDHPHVPLTLHYSGCLLEWLEEKAPDVVETLAELVQRGQVELMTGGFYEPILAALPHRDRVGQIEMLSDYLQARFGALVTGLWLAERVWEQDVVDAIVEAGATWTVLDDTILHAAGIDDAELTGPLITDHNDRPLLVYAGDRMLRYLIPYKRVERVIDHVGASPGRLFVYADDGEKFGEWPDTYDRVYGEGWLASFFSALQHDPETLELVKLGEHGAAPVGRVYPPSASYDEMMTWALPARARLRLGAARAELAHHDPLGVLPFARGAPWRAFLAKYPEANQLHKRMLGVSERVAAGTSRRATRELYRAQCNCAYWHGAFGGVYLPFMRAALWHHLMLAEAATNPPATGIEVADIDADLTKEVVLRASWGAAVIAPARGGRLVELDDHRIGANLLAVVARHREAYHIADESAGWDANGTEEGELEALSAHADPVPELTFDETGTGGLIDMIDGARVEGAYMLGRSGEGSVHLWREQDGLRVEKTIRLETGSGQPALACEHRVTNLRTQRRATTFGVQSFVLPLVLGRDAEPDVVTTTDASWRVGRADAEAELEATTDAPWLASACVIETTAATLDGPRLIPQGTQITTEWSLDLAPDESFAAVQRWRVVINDSAKKKGERGVSA